MPAPTPLRRACRARRRADAAQVAASAAVLAIMLSVMAGSATAQSGETVPAGVTTSLPSTSPSGMERGTAGSVVFFAVSAVIVVGALIIFLRRPNRPSRR
ncbi:MAG: hypothetical protein HYX32_02440 [Actinobacteria bacterium]|nr:hypothetical protein [Actinomycetota bacterium]